MIMATNRYGGLKVPGRETEPLTDSKVVNEMSAKLLAEIQADVKKP